MKYSPTRRSLLLAGLALPLASLSIPAWARANPLNQQLYDLEKSANGRLGVALIDIDSGRRFQYRGNERFAFCSTFKVMLAAAVLHKSQSQPGLKEKRIQYGEADLLAYAPITRTNLGKGMSVNELCAAAMQYSDNTAANLLIREIGGVKAVNQFARYLGDRKFRLDRIEPALNSATPDDPRDTTTPAAMAESLRKIVFSPALGGWDREQMFVWLRGNTTGNATIRAGVPANWLVGDKTGSGDYGATNDIGFIRPSTGGMLVLTLYFVQHEQKAEARRDVLAAATKLVVGSLGI